MLVVARRDELVRPGLQHVELAAQLGERFGRHVRIGTVAAALGPVDALFASAPTGDRIEAADPLAWLEKNLQKTVCRCFAGVEAAREAVARIPALLEGRFLVAVAAHETTFHKREERVPGPVVVGRSLKPQPHPA